MPILQLGGIRSDGKIMTSVTTKWQWRYPVTPILSTERKSTTPFLVNGSPSILIRPMEIMSPTAVTIQPLIPKTRRDSESLRLLKVKGAHTKHKKNSKKDILPLQWNNLNKHKFITETMWHHISQLLEEKIYPSTTM